MFQSPRKLCQRKIKYLPLRKEKWDSHLKQLAETGAFNKLVHGDSGLCYRWQN